MARPSLYTPVIAERICSLIAQGNSLRAIAAMDGLPSVEAMRTWLLRHVEFAAQYTRAREAQAEHFADEIVSIADREELDPQDRRVRIDARKWVAAKLLPKKYGDAMTLRGDKDNPLQFSTVKEMTEEQLLAVAQGESIE